MFDVLLWQTLACHHWQMLSLDTVIKGSACKPWSMTHVDYRHQYLYRRLPWKPSYPVTWWTHGTSSHMMNTWWYSCHMMNTSCHMMNTEQGSLHLVHCTWNIRLMITISPKTVCDYQSMRSSGLHQTTGQSSSDAMRFFRVVHLILLTLNIHNDIPIPWHGSYARQTWHRGLTTPINYMGQFVTEVVKMTTQIMFLSLFLSHGTKFYTKQ